MNILVASDSFKGTLSSKRVGLIVKEELSHDHHVKTISVSDGGEGLIESFQDYYPGQIREVIASDPLGREIQCQYILLSDQKKAIIESAMICGLPLLDVTERNPLITSTFGLGQLMKDAVNQGVKNIFIGLGGSSTNDAGIGLLSAMGVRFFDANGYELSDLGGKALASIASMDTTNIDAIKNEIAIQAICDVDNPLTGNLGATMTFGPQKGGSPQMLEVIEKGMVSFAQIVKNKVGHDFSSSPGAGAAGGLGFCLKSFFNASLNRGIETVLDLAGIDQQLNDIDLIITGEGKIDKQTEGGKVPLGLLQRGLQHQIPTICICGINEAENLTGFEKIFSVVPIHASREESLKNPEFFLRKMIQQEIEPWVKSFDAEGSGKLQSS